MKNQRWLFISAAILVGLSFAYAGKPAARMGDMTLHGGTITAGFPTVLIGGQPAARVGDMHVCPMITPPYIPHVGGPIITGAMTVLIGGQPAARVDDMAICAGGPPDAIAKGCPTVLIGDAPDTGGPVHEEEESQDDTTTTPIIQQPHVVPSFVPVQPQGTRLQSKQPTLQKNLSVVETGDRTISTPGKITIQSTEGTIEIVAGQSKIILDPSGRILIKGLSIDIEATSELTLKAMQVDIGASTSATLNAGTETKINGYQVTVNGTAETKITGGAFAEISGATTKVKGAVVMIN